MNLVKEYYYNPIAQIHQILPKNLSYKCVELQFLKQHTKAYHPWE